MHQREKLVAQAERRCQFARHLPPVADEEPHLPFTTCHQFILEALFRRARQAEQERRISVELIFASSRGRCDSGAEIEATTRAGANLRLPVIQLVTHQVETESDFMILLDLGGVDVAGETLIVAGDRGPVVLVAQGGVVRNVELRETALANVRAVGSGYS